MTQISQRELVTASLASTHHPDVYGLRAQRPANRPDPVALWRSSSRRGADARPAAAGETCERAAVERSPESSDAPRGTGRDGRGASPTHYRTPTCLCAHVAGDHNPIIGAGLFAKQIGRCAVQGCGCTGFDERMAA